MVFINHENKKIFIHIPKCGGSHIRNNLINYYNYIDFFDNIKHHKLNEFCEKIDKNVYDKHTITKKGKYRFFISHQNYDEKYNKYFKYTFVRNPYEKLYSCFIYLKNNIFDNNIRGLYENINYFTDFNSFIKNKDLLNNISYFHGFITQYEQLINNNNVIEMNFIGNMETLNEDFLYILFNRNINIHENHKDELFKNYKTNNSNKKYNFFDDFNQDILNFINEKFSIDFEYFNYKKYLTVDELKINYYKDIDYMKHSKYHIKLYKQIIMLEYNIKLLNNLFEQYETILNTDFEYKISILNDYKENYFFKLFENIEFIKNWYFYTDKEVSKITL